MRRPWSIAAAAALALAIGGCSGARPASIGAVTALDVQIAVRPDGGLDVVERLTVEPDEGTARIRRDLPTPYADTVVFRSAAIDGQAVVPGRDGFDVEARPDLFTYSIDRGAIDRPLEATVNYGVTAAVAVRQPRGRLVWSVLAAAREFEVRDVTVALTLPDGVAIYDGTGMAEAGWDVAVTDGRVTAGREDVQAAEAATLMAVFDIDRASVVQGQWEWDLDRQQEYGLALVAAGLFILVVGLGILAQLRVQYPPAGADASDEHRRAARADGEMLGRGLVLAGVVTLVAAAGAALAARLWLSGLGVALQAIPGSMAVVGALFLIAGWWYGRR